MRLVVLMLLSLGLAPLVTSSGTGTSFDCGGPLGIAENNTADSFSCWGHWGIHTYVVSDSHRVKLDSGYGEFMSVENWNGAIEGGVVVETSADSLAWITLATVPVTLDDPLRSESRWFSFTLPSQSEEFRFLRLREPKSTLGGLTGYLDFSWLVLNLTQASALTTTYVNETRLLTCQNDIHEDVFELSPCSFGGYFYDSPSFYHTYYLGGVANLTSIRVSASFLPFRAKAETAVGVLEYRTGSNSTWTPLTTWPTDLATTATSTWADPDGKQIEYLRVRTNPLCLGHPWPPQCPYPDHHYRGYVTFSELEVAGSLPVRS